MEPFKFHPRAKDITGQRFGRLLAIRPVGRKGRKLVWHAKCDCGREHVVVGSEMLTGHTQSCGCLIVDVNRALRIWHGMCGTRVYNTWARIKTRCFDQKCADYPDYGGRGITICDQWRDDFEAFYADVGDPPKGTSLDRIDNNRGYEPGNVRWATPKQQANNRRKNRRVTYGALTLTISEWADRKGINHGTIRSRLENGWPIGSALNVPAFLGRNSR